MSDKADLGRVRDTLIELEDNIIISLFGRARFKLNKQIYVSGAIKIPNFEGSFFDFLFKGTEELHAKAGRYMDQEEHPFYKNPPKSVISRRVEDIGIIKKTNFNSRLLAIYMEALSTICQPGDDDNTYGSSVIADIACLQNLSKRIHEGEQVAEAKYQQDIKGYQKLIEARDTAGILEKLTNRKVEVEILDRVRLKGERYHVDPKFIAEFYKDKIIPLTKDVEVAYFFRRDAEE
jgi:chorismate mutase